MSEADLLIARYLDGTAAVADAGRLDRMVREDPAVAQAFVRAAAVDAGLRQLHRIAEPSAAAAGSISTRIAAAERRANRRSQRRRRTGGGSTIPFPRLIAAASLLIACGALAWMLIDGPGQPAPFVAGSRPLPAGTRLEGTVGIAGGGTVVLAEGSLAVAAAGPDGPVLDLRRGEAACTVAPRPQGHFRVRTPHGGIAVIGTAFTVSVGDGTRLRVREGTVEVEAGGQRQRIGAGGQADLGEGVRIFQPVLRTLDLASAAAWNNNSKDASATPEAQGPTGAPALLLDFRAPQSWASCVWKAGMDWRDADGVSVVMHGSGSGQRLALEIMDDGPDAQPSGRDAYERFAAPFIDDATGWHERRFPFKAFVRRKDLWPGMPDNGFGRDRVHGISLIAVDGPGRFRIERVGIYRDR